MLSCGMIINVKVNEPIINFLTARVSTKSKQLNDCKEERLCLDYFVNMKLMKKSGSGY